MSYSQGDVVLVPFPFTNLTVTKTRPAIIVSNKIVNNTYDVILAQITTQPVKSPWGLTISNSDVTVPFRPPYTSMNVHYRKIAVIEKSLIRTKITKLSNEKLEELLNLISSMFKLDK